MSVAANQINLEGPAALRALARAFGQFGEFDQFVRALQSALDGAALFQRAVIALDRDVAADSPRFSAGALSIPLAEQSAQFGVLQVAPKGERRQFGPADIHLMAGLADFLSAVLAQSLRMQDAEKSRGLLRFLLNLAPVGIAACTTDNRVLIANDLAARWIAEAPLPFDLFDKPGGFHIRAAGKLIFGEARRAPDEALGAWLVVLHDLTMEQGRLLESVKRETYRALAEGRSLGFALIEGADARDGALRRLAELRSTLQNDEAVGPYDAHRLGVLLPGVTGLALRARLRRMRTVLGANDRWKLSVAELGRDGRSPEGLLDAALRRTGAYEQLVRPSVLVYDENPAVAATIAMVIGRDYHVVQSTDSERTRQLLAQDYFDGFVIDMEARRGPSGVEWAQLAREKQPGIRTFLTTVQRASFGLPDAGDSVLIEKPFDVAKLRQTLRDNLAG